MSSSVQTSGDAVVPFRERVREWRIRHANIEFALLGMVATVIAFRAAILLNVQAPYSAAVTVWVVANTRPGHVLSKSVYRVLGTILGASAGITIVALFDSVPLMLFTVLAFWIAVCTGLGNLLRHFRTYFGLLAGYTAAFVVLGAYRHPDHVLDVALDRASAIIVGVLAMSLVVSLLGLRRSAGEIEEILRGIQSRCLGAITGRWKMHAEEVTAARLALGRSYAEGESLLEYAGLERPGFGGHVKELRVFTGFMLDLIDASRLAFRQLERVGKPVLQEREIRSLFLEIADALVPALDRLDEIGLGKTRDQLGQVRMLAGASAELAETPWEKELLYPIVHLLDEWTPRLRPDVLSRLPLRDPLQVDFRGAGRHVLRTFLGLMAAVVFWNLTKWQEGPGFLINGAAFCALASVSGHPGRTLLMFSKATACASAAGFLCKFVLMPAVSGFWPQMACMAVVLVPLSSLAFSARPLLDVIGSVGGLFTIAMMQPANHMSYDPAAYVSSALAAVFGAFFLSVVFSLVMPSRPGKEAGEILSGLEGRLKTVAIRKRVLPIHQWRIIGHRALRDLQTKAKATASESAEGLRLLDRGSCLVRLRELSSGLDDELRSAIGDACHASLRTGGDGSVPMFRMAAELLRADTRLPECQRHTIAAQLSELRALSSPSPTLRA